MPKLFKAKVLTPESKAFYERMLTLLNEQFARNFYCTDMIDFLIGQFKLRRDKQLNFGQEAINYFEPVIIRLFNAIAYSPKSDEVCDQYALMIKPLLELLSYLPGCKTLSEFTQKLENIVQQLEGHIDTMKKIDMIALEEEEYYRYRRLCALFKYSDPESNDEGWSARFNDVRM